MKDLSALIQRRAELRAIAENSTSIVANMRSTVSILRSDKSETTLTASQLQNIADGKGKVIYMGAHPKRKK